MRKVLLAMTAIAMLSGGAAQARDGTAIAVLGGVAAGAVIGSALSQRPAPVPVYVQPAPPPVYVQPAPYQRVALVSSPFDDQAFHLKGACDRGNLGACVRFGVLIGKHQERVAVWRQMHPDFFFYEN